ncbi:MAG: ACP phosphodiesterase [Ferruginibacter sp.]
MNYLAHAWLSFNDPDILAGNMISDFVKGKKKFDYPLSIQKGITLHRAIDEFTDAHPVTKQAMVYFKADYRLYSGAFIDIVYDHFLANDKNEFKNEQALEQFCNLTYTALENNFVQLPLKFQQMLPYMKQQNWLYNYRFRPGIERSFGGLVKRAVYLTECAVAFQIFNDHYNALNDCYHSFFPLLKEFAIYRLAELNEG